MKTRLGTSVAIAGSAIYFLALFGNYTVSILLTGYVLLFETNEWLRKSSIKALAICVLFSIISTIIGLIPNIINLIDNIFNIFGKGFSIAIVSKIISPSDLLLSIVRKLIFLMLGFKALHQGTIRIGLIDRVINKHTNLD